MFFTSGITGNGMSVEIFSLCSSQLLISINQFSYISWKYFSIHRLCQVIETPPVYKGYDVKISVWQLLVCHLIILLSFVSCNDNWYNVRHWGGIQIKIFVFNLTIKIMKDNVTCEIQIQRLIEFEFTADQFTRIEKCT